MKIKLALLPILAVWVASGPVAQEPGASAKGDFSSRGEELLKLVKDRFYEVRAADAWCQRNAGFGASIKTEEEFAEAAKARLMQLKTSHTAYFDLHDPEYFGLQSIFKGPLQTKAVEYDSPGMDVTTGRFVRVVFAGRPAEQAGLKRGDRILTADGRSFHRIDSFRDRAGQPVKLQIQREAAGAIMEVTITPRRIDPAVEWLEAEQKGARLIERNGKKIGYVPLFSCAGGQYQDALQEIYTTTLRSADALILDFRNGWGGCSPSFVNLFNQTPPVLTLGNRGGKQDQVDLQWRKPLFILINGGSTSGKEVVAFAVKKHRLGTLVGKRTAGAVLAGTCIRQSSGALVYLAVSEVLVDGRKLEGVGVEPDVEVEDRLPFANGADPQWEKALELAAR